MTYRLFILTLLVYSYQYCHGQSGLCDPITPFYEVNLVGNPGGTWQSDPPVIRDGHCCGVTGPSVCIEFEITLDPNALAISFEIIDGAIPGGSLFYQINCGPQVQVGDPICMDTPGPHTLTFCKPGNNLNTYAVTSISAPVASPDLNTSEGCNITLDVSGLDLSSIEWNSIFPGITGQYNSLLSCNLNCDQAVFSPPIGSPPYIDYQVCGVPLAGNCAPNPLFCDTIRVFIDDPILIEINPSPAIFCSTSSGIALTATLSNVDPPYTITWIDPNGLPISNADTVFATIPGDYIAVVDDQSPANCLNAQQVITVEVQPITEVDAGETLSICPTNAVVNLSGTISNSNSGTWIGPGGFFIPSNADLNTSYYPNDSVIASGYFQLYLNSAADAVCGVVTDTIEVFVTDSLSLEILHDPIDCHGNSTNLIGLAQGGEAPYQFNWDIGSTDPIINVSSGIYNLSIEDQLGCEIEEQIILNDPPEIQIDLISIGNSNCGQNNGSICLTASGGTGPLNIVWDNQIPINGNCVENLLAGCYTVNVFDVNGCSKDSVFCITDLEGPSVSLLSLENISCFNDNNGQIHIDVQSVSPPIEIHWFDALGNELTQFLNLQDVFNLVPGCYVVKVVDVAGCEAYDSYCINEPSQLVSNIETQAVNCYGSCDGSVFAYASGGTGPYNYSWSSGNFMNSSFNNGLCTGDVILTVTDMNSCVVVESAFISSPDEININSFSQENVSCFGICDASLSVGVEGGSYPYFFYWLNEGVNSQNLSNICAGNYEFAVSDINGCDTSFTYTITEPSEIILDYIKEDATCGDCNGSVEILVQGGVNPYSVQWLSGQTEFEINNALCAADYFVTVLDDDGCSKSIDFDISTIDGPMINGFILQEPLCFEDNNGSISVLPSGGQIGGAYDIQWGSSAFFQTTETAGNLYSGFHCVTVTDDNDCEVNDCIYLPEPTPVQSIGFGSDSICFGESVDLYSAAIGGTTPYEILWLNGQDLDVNGIATVNPENDAEYCFVIIDDHGCISGETCLIVNVSDPLNTVVSNGIEICAGTEGELNATFSGGNENIPIDVQWYEGALFSTLISSVEDGFTSTASVIPVADTYYYVMVDDGCSEMAYDSVLVTTITNPQPIISTNNTTGCAPLLVQVVLGTTEGISYNFDFDCDGVVDLISDTTFINYNYEQSGTYDLCVSVFNPSGCFAELVLEDEVTVHPKVDAGFTVQELVQTNLDGQSIEFFDQSTSNTMNTWNFGDNTEIIGAVGSTISNQFAEHTWGTYDNPTHNYSQAGTYEVHLIANNIYGCADEVSAIIKVDENFGIYAPNAFTPDASGNNDVFQIVGYNIEQLEFKLRIHDRWGNIVFYSEDANVGWDGTNGEGYYLKEDVYVWRLILRDSEGNNHEFQGHVTLIR